MSIATQVGRLQTAKADIKTSIENKGVEVDNSATIDEYASYVDEIQQGGGGLVANEVNLISSAYAALSISNGTNYSAPAIAPDGVGGWFAMLPYGAGSSATVAMLHRDANGGYTRSAGLAVADPSVVIPEYNKQWGAYSIGDCLIARYGQYSGIPLKFFSISNFPQELGDTTIGDYVSGRLVVATDEDNARALLVGATGDGGPTSQGYAKLIHYNSSTDTVEIGTALLFVSGVILTTACYLGNDRWLVHAKAYRDSAWRPVWHILSSSGTTLSVVATKVAATNEVSALVPCRSGAIAAICSSGSSGNYTTYYCKVMVSGETVMEGDPVEFNNVSIININFGLPTTNDDKTSIMYTPPNLGTATVELTFDRDANLVDKTLFGTLGCGATNRSILGAANIRSGDIYCGLLTTTTASATEFYDVVFGE